MCKVEQAQPAEQADNDAWIPAAWTYAPFACNLFGVCTEGTSRDSSIGIASLLVNMFIEPPCTARALPGT